MDDPGSAEFDEYLDAVLIGGREERVIELVDYRPEWAERFTKERERIAGAMGSTPRRIEHVGSTAVAGLAAKPIVDILVTVDDPDDESGYVDQLERAGYELRVREPGHRMFRTPERDVHVHIWADGSEDARDQVAFRDWLRSHPADRAEYERTKRAARGPLPRHELLRAGEERRDQPHRRSGDPEDVMADEMFSLEGRVAIVTGSGTGIGRATAQVLAEHGADIVLAARRAELLERTAASIRETGRRALVVPTDVTDADACERLVAATMEEFGHVDVLVNNAGGSLNKAPEDWTVAEWHEIVDLNLASVWFMSRLVAAPMLEQGRGAIVNISSGASFLALPMVAPYGAAKAGMNSLTRSLAAAWTERGVRVNAVACGAVKTEGYGTSTKQADLPDDVVLGPGNAIGRIGRPEEIAYPVLFFASDASSYCSGQTLWVNGGTKAPSTS